MTGRLPVRGGAVTTEGRATTAESTDEQPTAEHPFGGADHGVGHR